MGEQGRSQRPCLSWTTQPWDTHSAPLFLIGEKSCHLLMLPVLCIISTVYTLSHTDPQERPLCAAPPPLRTSLPFWSTLAAEVHEWTALRLLESPCLRPSDPPNTPLPVTLLGEV